MRPHLRFIQTYNNLPESSDASKQSAYKGGPDRWELVLNARATMLRHIVLCLAVCAYAAAHKERHHRKPSTESPPTGDPITITPSGAIRGSWMTTRRGRHVQAYRGIPYAEPPTGEYRFQPPRLITSYSSEVNATAEGPGCPQPVATSNFYIDEDCLRLNVYTTNNQRKNPVPVLVYLHSGGFYSGSGRSDVAGPSYLLDRELVLVAVNYRLASLGFISTGDEHAPGNNGLKDQVAALKWVQTNIRSFGGDPSRVTLAGCSAGAFSVMLHMLSPMSKGLFHRGISISGSPISQAPERYHQRELAERQARLVGCPTTSSKEIIDCLKTKDYREIGDTLDGFFDFGYDPVLVWAPVIEPDVGQERFLDLSPLEMVQQGKMHSVPYIISQTTGEFFWKAFNVLANETYTTTMDKEWDRIAPISFILPKENAAEKAQKLRQEFLGGRQLVNDSFTADGLGKLYGDSIIGFGVHRLANLMCKHSPHKVYYYEFAHVGNSSHYIDPETGCAVKAAHHDDLIYLFSLPAAFPLIPPADTKDSHVVDKMTALYYNFARNGDPNPSGSSSELGSLHWPAMTPATRRYLRVGSSLDVRENLFEHRFRVWNRLYPIEN
ncbi:carboxylic ester hydrolase-like [Ostrinia nubilalis]|uniref:carboxylic ester hydrolase-like n=1 Tax=Ostrinia nubilalis TaxID=29057 RepID=UPI003082339F